MFRSRTYDAHAMSSFCTADRFSDMTNTWLLPSGNGTRLAASAPCSNNQKTPMRTTLSPHHPSATQTHHSIKTNRKVPFPPQGTSRGTAASPRTRPGTAPEPRTSASSQAQPVRQGRLRVKNGGTAGGEGWVAEDRRAARAWGTGR